MTDSKYSPDTEKSGALKRKQSTSGHSKVYSQGAASPVRKIDPVTGEIIAVISTQDSKQAHQAAKATDVFRQMSAIGTGVTAVIAIRQADYDLAESLMDAGFPQIGKGRLIGPLNKLVWRSGDRVYVPILEELIEGCGENFGSLDNQHDRWLASANYDQSCFAKTPAEAVARLWLALQKR